MSEKKEFIPFYNDINCFLSSIPVRHQTSNPLFYCMRLSEHIGDIYKPPFRRGFFFLALLTSKGNTQVGYNDTNEDIKDSFLVFLQTLFTAFSGIKTPMDISSISRKNALIFSSRNLPANFPFSIL
jgi:hypothetical protein